MIAPVSVADLELQLAPHKKALTGRTAEYDRTITILNSRPAHDVADKTIVDGIGRLISVASQQVRERLEVEVGEIRLVGATNEYVLKIAEVIYS